MSTYTPGPWSVLNLDGGQVSIQAEDGSFVALVYEPVRGNQARNAHLIAAAPDLLAALKSVLEELEGREDVRDGADGMQLPNEAMCILNEHGDAMRAAIAKAEGQE